MRSRMRAAAALLGVALGAGLPLFPGAARAYDLAENPERSLLVGFELGVGLDADGEARRPDDLLAGGAPEAYRLPGFQLGLFAGYRFNEHIGVEAGWHQSRHLAVDPWGAAYYQVGHVALRVAVPTPTRLTPVILAGPAIGAFSFGVASPGMLEDNEALVVGGEVGAMVEHELGLGVVAALKVAYLPLYRRDMGGRLELTEVYYDGSDEIVETVAAVDFGEGTVVHLVWISVGLQFEWTFR